MNKYIQLLSILLLLIIFIFITAKSYATTVSSDLKDNFFRLHIIANSDSNIDQELKLKVRDKVLEYMSSLDYKSLSKQEVIKITKENLTNIESIAQKTILENGFNYSISSAINTTYFPTKYYGNISLPAGYYDSLIIKIGNANGQNWWCSLFPPLCFIDISSGVIDDESSSNLQKNLSPEEFNIITSDSKPIKIKFKLVELLSK